MENKELLQAVTDALTGLAEALAKQLDRKQLAYDLHTLAEEALESGQAPSAALLDEMARTLESRR